MVQEFHIVRCFSCEAFQVDQVKKSTNKWSCKICNEKQSVKRVYFRGVAKDCRQHCQLLNKQRLEMKSVDEQRYLDNDELNDITKENKLNEAADENNYTSSNYIPTFIANSENNGNNSRWQTYLSDNDQEETEDSISNLTVMFRDSSNSYGKSKRSFKHDKKKPYEMMSKSQSKSRMNENVSVRKEVERCHSDDNFYRDTSIKERSNSLLKDTKNEANVSLFQESSVKKKVTSKWNEFIADVEDE